VHPSNTALYAAPGVLEGVDFLRRHRHRAGSDTVVIAPHGGGIEPGTSELAVAIAGRTHSYWLFEGLRPADNGELHVTAENCDDPVALSLLRTARTALAVHGCAGETPEVLVGGRDAALRRLLLARYHDTGFRAVDASRHEGLSGTSRYNVVNRTRTRRGGQIELSTALRASMFTRNTTPRRVASTNDVFWRFVEATRTALAERAARRAA
jgi:phage replication-related protein YjqB (UPF0714/DUF867 family)